MEIEKIKVSYNRAAKVYGEHFFDELQAKRFDRLLLKEFALENISKGKMIDLGCGPGQTARVLSEWGVNNLLAIDLSEKMIKIAKKYNPKIEFKVADILNLHFEDGSFNSAVAFYAIVHFDFEQLKIAFAEVNRILERGGHFLISFHVGKDIFHRDEFFGVPVDLDFIYFQTEDVLKLLRQSNFKIIEAVERYPYDYKEFPSKRAYIWVEKI